MQERKEMVNFSRERINSYNNWPSKNLFKAEKKFQDILENNNNIIPFFRVKIEVFDDPDYQRCVGHLIDALEELPERPDYSFDHFFKIIDLTGNKIFGANNGIKGIVHKLGPKLISDNQESWESIIDALCQATPNRTYEYIASRIIQASQPDPPKYLNGLNTRAQTCLGTPLYQAFVEKYAFNSDGPVLNAEALKIRERAGRFLKIYMSGKKLSKLTKQPSHPILDLSKQKNIADHNKRSRILPSLLLYTLRNERFHGGTISPFKTSRANIDRYRSYYFSMLVAYIFALGALNVAFGAAPHEAIDEGCLHNIKLQNTFFA